MSLELSRHIGWAKVMQNNGFQLETLLILLLSLQRFAHLLQSRTGPKLIGRKKT